ncbi:MAG: lytic murein transglycosylase, partial [Nocardioidaceae bacterium]|nr:lytic murein transglycosylase [Nocardioidaceae bacterium]
MGSRRARGPDRGRAGLRRPHVPGGRVTTAATLAVLVAASSLGGSGVTLSAPAGAATADQVLPGAESVTVPEAGTSWVAQALTSQSGALAVGDASGGLFALSGDKRPRVVAADGLPLGRGGRDAVATSSATVDGIPTAALAAYYNAESVLRTVKSSCNLSWSLLAGIGRVESDHGRYGGAKVKPDGRAEPEIIGLPLNGKGPVAAIADSDQGRLDGDGTWDRAVGPLQFIPTTWAVVGSDGDGDDVRDPHDFDDAALAAAVYLCSGDGDLSTRAGAEAAVGRYNHSDEYVALVLAYAKAYENGELPDDLAVSTSPTDASSVPTVDEPVTQPPVGPPLDSGADDAKRPRNGGNGGGNGGGDGDSPDTSGPTQRPPATPQPSPETSPTPDPTPTPDPKPTPTPDPKPTPAPPSEPSPEPEPTEPSPEPEPTEPSPEPEPT